MLLMVVGTTGVAVVISLLTPPEDEKLLLAFLQRARPFAFGWQPIIKKLGAPYVEIENFQRTLASWIIATAAVFCLLYGIGQLLLGPFWQGTIFLFFAGLGIIWTVIRMKEDYQREIEVQGTLP